MRRVAAGVVLAAAIATPGIVVAATSAHDHSLVSETATGEFHPLSPGRVNPKLRPAVNAVKAAFAAKGIELVVTPVGSQAAEAVQLAPHGQCPIWIIFRRNSNGEDLLPECSSRGVIGRDELTITFTPTSAGPTIEHALGVLPGVIGG